MQNTVQLSFVHHIHNIGKSNLFLAGIILFSAGSILSIFSGFNATMGILSLFLNAMPVIALWLIFAASTRPMMPEKTLTALTLFKITAVFMLFSAGLMIPTLVILFLETFLFTPYPIIGPPHVSTTYITLVAAYVAVSLLYYIPLLKILSNIRQSIIFNTIHPVHIVRLFTVSAVLMVIFRISSSIFLATVGIYALMDNSAWFINSLMQGLLTATTLSIVSNLVISAGIIILVICLNKLSCLALDT